MQRVILFSATAAPLIQFTKHDLTALQTLGCEIHMVCNMQEQTASKQAIHLFQKQFPGLIWHDLPFSDAVFAANQNRKAQKKLTALLQKLKPALLHCHGAVAGKYGRMAANAIALDIPVFYTAHDFRLYRGNSLADRFFFGKSEKQLAKTTAQIFTVCPADTAYIQKHLSPKAVKELKNTESIDGTYYASPQHTAMEMRETLSIPADAMVLLSAGSLYPQKRFRIVMQAMTRLRDLTHLHYVICGEGPDRFFLEKLAEKLHLTSRVHLLGYRTDMPDLLEMADIFCMTSRREGCGTAALEAMAAGLPLVVTRVHGTEAFANENSAICLKGDLVTSCADAIRQLTENKLLRKQIGARNRAAAVIFSDKERMMQMRDCYRRALSETSEVI